MMLPIQIVRIGLGVPGGELVVKHEPSQHSSIEEQKTAKHLEIDAPHIHLEVAIRDAFRSARRQLQDYARRQRGDVKIHETLQARVVELFPEKGYGVLETADGRAIYLRKNSVLEAVFGRIKGGPKPLPRSKENTAVKPVP